MNYKFSCNQWLISSALASTIGLVGATAVFPTMVSALSKEPLLTAQTSSLSGSWRLANMTESAAPTPMVPSQDTELTVDFADGRISGSGGCNRFMGGYETQGEQLSIGPLASTFMACEEAVMTQETRYLNALQSAQQYVIDDQGQLTIVYQTEQESGVLRFTSQSVQALW